MLFTLTSESSLLCEEHTFNIHNEDINIYAYILHGIAIL
jgi:hypothetical protein